MLSFRARALGNGTQYTMGHSMGGMTAIFCAALDENVAGTIAITTGYGRPTSLEALQRVGVTDFRASYVVGVPLPELVAGIEKRYDELLPRLARASGALYRGKPRRHGKPEQRQERCTSARPNRSRS